MGEQKTVEAAELKAEVQIRQAYSAYQNAVERVRHYDSGILKNAETVLDAKRFSYQHGQAALLELLNAQRTANEVRSPGPALTLTGCGGSRCGLPESEPRGADP